MGLCVAPNCVLYSLLLHPNGLPYSLHLGIQSTKNLHMARGRGHEQHLPKQRKIPKGTEESPLVDACFSFTCNAKSFLSLNAAECSGRCAGRCSATAYKKPCMFFCQKCCAKCLCVPPGTYGNKQFCPCYNNWKTKRGGPKCP
ncbi:hypothetical protein GW17_00054941 [Ensete ventricosum]|nr:hypothetical protein GW17_00054941 [Ensete ventricosum]